MAFEDEQSTHDHDQDLIPDTLDTNSPADRDDDETIMAHKPTLKSREKNRITQSHPEQLVAMWKQGGQLLLGETL